MARLQEKYAREVVPALRKQHGYTNSMQVPRMTKIVVNMGFNATLDKDVMKSLLQELARITGQQPAICKARKSIANFNLREGMTVGARVTLRGRRMYEFFDRLTNVALSRLRDFRGVSPKGFDGRGNFSMGLRDQTVFPEINPDDVKKVQGMDITVNTTAVTDDEARDLLRLMGMPFAKVGAVSN
ncbi:MAG: 50S ribosomal protein L5 [Kiritimatiellia bacterium]|nr:50S ribosomal protein L5 [Lentisphaerota bacterium]